MDPEQLARVAQGALKSKDQETDGLAATKRERHRFRLQRFLRLIQNAIRKLSNDGTKRLQRTTGLAYG